MSASPSDPEPFPALVTDIPTAAPRLGFIDTLRGFACLWVLFCHVHAFWLGGSRLHGWNLPALLVRIAGFGGRGVSLFIVLSGFCLYWPIAQKGPAATSLEVGTFYRRRARRILPVYYAGLAFSIAFATIPATQGLVTQSPPRAIDCLLHVLLMQTFRPGSVGAINGSYWSLCLEIQLYLTYPLTLWILRRRGMVGLLACAAASAILSQALVLILQKIPATSEIHLISLHLPACWILFTCGMWAAGRVRRAKPSDLRSAMLLAAVLAPVCIAGQAVVSKTNLPLDIMENALWGVLFAMLLVALSRLPGGLFHHPFQLGWLTWIGTVSYSLYVIHQPAMLLCTLLVQRMHLGVVGVFAVFITIGLPLLLAAAYVFFRCFERPFMVRRRSE